MTKDELVAQVAEKTGAKKTDVKATLEAAHDAIRGALATGQDVRITGFGTFRPKQNAARSGRNPRTGEPVQIGASTSVKFKPAREFGDQLNRR